MEETWGSVSESQGIASAEGLKDKHLESLGKEQKQVKKKKS